MKHLKRFNESVESLQKRSGVGNAILFKSLCKEYGIENYTINSDGSVDVDGDVDLSNKNLTKLPIKFRNVRGYFYCSTNQLTSLEGCPQSVGGAFSCHSNKLTSLEGCPKSVGGNFYCKDNQLTSLEGGPQSVGGDFDCGDNKLTSLKGLNKEQVRNIYSEGNNM